MAQYTVEETSKPFGDKQDWYSVKFKEYPSEAVSVQSEEPVTVGQVFNGHIGTSRSGKPKFMQVSPFHMDQKDILITSGMAVKEASALIPEIEAVDDNFKAKPYKEKLYQTAELIYDVTVELARSKSDG